MPFLNGLTLLLGYQLLGEIISRWFKLPIPGPVLGMALLFISLLVHQRVPVALETASTALLSHLSLLFIPAGVGLMLYFDALSKEWLPILITLIFSTLMSMAVIALSMQLLMKLFKPKAASRHEAD